MSTLAALQRQFQSHILEGDAALADEIDSTESVSASTRLGIYSDAYRVRLIEALQANYPVLDRLLGADEFARLTQLYLSSHPSRHFSIRWFGHRLAEFLQDYDEYRLRPWLAELANWEWKVTIAFDARAADLLALEDLSTIAPDEWPSLRLRLQPSVQRIGVASNVTEIVKAMASEEAMPAGRAGNERVEWMIWRRDLDVKYRLLSTIEAAALDCVQGGGTFEEMCEVIAEHIETDAVPQHAAQLLRSWIDEQLLEKAIDQG
jgi:hypothetical protein